MQLLDDFVRFLDRSPTVFHAAQEIMTALSNKGFVFLKEGDDWNLEPGKGYFICRSDSFVAAFRTPNKQMTQATILASHTDSPCLKIKPHPEQITKSIGQLYTEIYGSPLLHSWLDRDLCLAGQITALDRDSNIQSNLVFLDQYPTIIPQLALHFDRTINDKGIIVQKQDHLKPIFSLNAKDGSFEGLLKKQYDFSTLLAFDLFLVSMEKACFLGESKECISSQRLDNLTSVYAALHALLGSASCDHALQIAFFWDHEEVGSVSCLGANSCSADQILERISLSFKMSREEYFQMKSRSLCLSGDLTHGFHPNFPDRSDVYNAPLLGSGPALKFNASQRYATSGIHASRVMDLAKRHLIPLQTFTSRSDIASGSTVGPLMASQLGIATVDLGIPGWAMHSIRETIAAQDEVSLFLLFQAALNEGI